MLGVSYTDRDVAVVAWAKFVYCFELFGLIVMPEFPTLSPFSQPSAGQRKMLIQRLVCAVGW